MNQFCFGDDVTLEESRLHTLKHASDVGVSDTSLDVASYTSDFSESLESSTDFDSGSDD